MMNSYPKIPDTDLNQLKTIGFDVKLLIGSGEFGSVYSGVYEHNASGFRDIEGQLLDVVVGQKFAIKYIDIKRIEDLELRNGRIKRMESIRRHVENRKRLRHSLLDSDLLQFKFCVNLGDYQTICLNTRVPQKAIPLVDIDVRPSYDRLYLLMDFSEIGNLDNYLMKIGSNGLTVTEIEANIWCKRLLSAVGYLHESKVFGLNIKPNNVLMFEEYIESENKTYVVPKLSDFLINNCFNEPNDDITSDDTTQSSSDEKVPSRTESLEKLSEMTDIYQLTEIFQKIISKTSFKTEFNYKIVMNLNELMKQFNQKPCEHFSRVFDLIFYLFD